MLSSFFRHVMELVYPPTDFTRIPRAPLDLTGEFVRLDTARIELNRPPFCLKCSRHLGCAPDEPLCPTCRRFPPAFDFAWSACLYHHSLIPLLHAYKYHQKTLYRHLFGQILTEFVAYYQLDIHQFDLLLPVPLHPARRRERGYNQAELLAVPLGRHYDLPVLPAVLQRTRFTLHQTDLSSKERWTNLAGAFKIAHQHTVKDKNILLIDDLITTGATASAAATTLKSAGAATVAILTLGTTP